ncbi:MAG TPA: 4-hydroxythreonine-4-phosphate dehydrogenase PdxA, partial [Steroidobacteraceae bacterium]|nr:4-hydroxythreonine-4-phosphate dehydrogenase PdxA [Steroidobacteraceae bacterium]
MKPVQTFPDTYLPRIILTSGEPAGVGPDLCLKLAEQDWPCDLIVAADPGLLGERARLLNLDLQVEPYSQAAERVSHRARSLRVLAIALAAPAEPGRLNRDNARYVLGLLDRAIDGCVQREFDAMVTAPVQKSVINDAGIPFTGHTEYIAARTQASRPVMMLVAERLRVALATTHLPLRAVSKALSGALLREVLRVLDTDLRQRFGIARPRILVCGLNPHAGEGGHLGREEIEVIAPAVHEARRAGIDASGPVPADTAFTPRSLAGADVVLAMYHDQGLPVLK